MRTLDSYPLFRVLQNVQEASLALIFQIARIKGLVRPGYQGWSAHKNCIDARRGGINPKLDSSIVQEVELDVPG